MRASRVRYAQSPTAMGAGVTGMCGRKDLSGTRLDPHQAVLVANLTGEPSARFAAARINRLSLEYLADPQMLRPSHPPDAPLAPAPVEPRAAAVREPSSARVAPMEPTISPGTVLDGPSILTFCRARDLGAAAATGDPANPPEILRGVDPSRWPQLVVKGRQAVTDLVGSVIPMVFAPTRRNTERCGHPRSDVRRTGLLRLVKMGSSRGVSWCRGTASVVRAPASSPAQGWWVAYRSRVCRAPRTSRARMV